jgi:hypothetical protein
VPQRWPGGFRIYRALFLDNFPMLSKDGLFYDDKPTDWQWTPLGPADFGRYTSARGGTRPPAMHGRLKSISLSGALMEVDHELLL